MMIMAAATKTTAATIIITLISTTKPEFNHIDIGRNLSNGRSNKSSFQSDK